MKKVSLLFAIFIMTLSPSFANAEKSFALTKGTIIDLDRAVHGSAYQYDRNVPLIFMGTGVTAGTSAKLAYTVDVAPTLATLAGVSFPVNLDGKPLLKPRK